MASTSKSTYIINTKSLLDDNESEDEEFDDKDGSDNEVEEIEQDNLDSCSEQEASENEFSETTDVRTEMKVDDLFIGRGAKNLTGKRPGHLYRDKKGKVVKPTPNLREIEDIYKWKKTPYTSRTKVRQKNILTIRPGLSPSANDITDECSAFQKIIDSDMIEDILKYTNIYIARKAASVEYSRDRDCKETSKTEILALLGALFLIGIKRGHHTNVLELWNEDGTGIIALRALMSYKRFLFLLRCLRFDDSSTRAERRETDKLAAIRSMLDRFIDNCKKNYIMGEYITIDEMLHPFRGRCSFVQYIPNKPAKYGLKILACCDAKSFYTGNLEVYCGQQMDGPYKVSNSPADVVKRLVQPFEKNNRNLTADNWYSSYALANDLLQKKITFIGTMRKNKREILSEFLPNENREVNSVLFGFQKNMTMVSYVPRKNKAVILLSTMHDSPDVDEKTKKPNIILDYNATKGAVNTVDEMCAAYSVSRITRRWPLALFFVLMNIAGINAQILYFTKWLNQNQYRRRLFLKDLAMGLMREHFILRSAIYSLPIDISAYLKRYRSEEIVDENQPSTSKRGRCRLCVNTSTTLKCEKCMHFVCKKHSKTITTCLPCLEAVEGNESSTNSSS